MISLWENWVLLMKWGQRNSQWFEACSGRFHTLVGPQAPQGSQVVPNGHYSVLWEVEIKYSSMGWFHYGKTGPSLQGSWAKEYMMIWGMFWPFSGSGGPPSTPKGPQRFLIDDLVHHDNLRGNILQQDDFTMGKISVTQLKGGPTNIW